MPYKIYFIRDFASVLNSSIEVAVGNFSCVTFKKALFNWS